MQESQGATAREIARRAKVIAEVVGRPGLAFTHRAVSGWLNGTRNPSLEHRRLLAVILGVSFDELNHGCDELFDVAKASHALRIVNVRVFGRERIFEYRMTVSSRLNFDRPAVYQHWAEPFSPWPASLARHFGRLKYDLYGWIPAIASIRAASHSGILVPLNTRRQKLEKSGTLNPDTWFVYLPEERLAVGKAVRENRRLLFWEHRTKSTASVEYALSRVDLIGRVAAMPLCEITNSNLSRGDRTQSRQFL